MRLQKIEIENFKGIKLLTINFGGLGASIFGDNETGKTTVADSVFWLLFGKDSLNRADFEIKPLDDAGQVQHGVESTVEGTWIDGAKTLVLKKVHKEIWTKKRGTATQTFTGNTVDHFINGVPVQKKEYDETIKDIADDTAFKLLTDPRYFNEVMHWEDRRALLLEVCGDITDADVIDSMDAIIGTGKGDVDNLINILNQRSIDDHKKVVAARRKEINKDLEKIPVRIDESSKSLKVVDRKKDVIQTDINAEEVLKKAAQEELNLVENGGEVATLKMKRAGINAKISNADAAFQQKLNAANLNKENGIAAARANLDLTTTDRDAKKKALHDLKTLDIPLEQGRLETLHTDYKRIQALEFTPSQGGACPSCKQDLPADQIEAANKAALEAFNKSRAEQLETNISEGKATKGRLETLNAKKGDLADEIEKLDAKIKELTEAEIKARAEVVAIEKSSDHVELMAKLEEIDAKISNAGTSDSDTAEKLKASIQTHTNTINELNIQLLAIAENERVSQRIKDLQQQEKDLAAEFERLESELNMIDSFTRKKVEMLDEKINSKFKLARFKLFKEQVNGGLAECCEMTVKGVPYRSLNNAMRINAGLDICETLSEHYGVSLPVIVDNAEAVTDLYQTTAQQIRLIVSPGQKELLVQVDEVDKAA